MSLLIKNVSCSYQDKPVLNQINMQIEPGEFVSLIGPSGCGKSTLLNILAGTVTDYEGTIQVNGQTVTGYNPYFAYMPQEDLLFNWKTVEENIQLYQRIHKLQVSQEKLAHYLQVFGLAKVAKQFPHELSGGMRQRVALLRTMMVERDILLLDEPFGALDVMTRQGLQDWLASVRTQLGKTILLVTHDIDEALYLSDRIFIMGGSPTTITDQLDLSNRQPSRQWLTEQGDLRYNIYQKLQQRK